MLKFLSDSPINTKKDDILKRYKFSLRLGDALLQWSDETSIVLGLYGEWGSGKSSIVNMAIEHVQKKTNHDEKKPIVIRFNPWSLSEQNQLVSSFLEQLAKSINYVDNSKDAVEVGKRLEAYSKLFSPLSMIPVPLISAVGIALEKTLKGVGDATKAWGEANTKSIEQLKDEVNESIRKIGRKVIIIIDDIDRLNPVEIKQIFQLVKQNANFINTIYVLEFDFEKVARAIASEGQSGKDYIEKIVQVPFKVPVIERANLEQFLFRELDKTIKPFPESLWDSTRWANLYHSGLKYYFSSLRAVKRFINSLNFNIGHIADDVNPIDFIGIETLRLFCPEIYSAISKNSELFTEISDRDHDQAARKKQIDEILALAGPEHQEKIKEIVFKLFPQVDGLYNNHGWGYDVESDWHKTKRVCSKRRFDNYFMLSVPSKDLTQVEINYLAKNANDPKEVKRFIQKLQKLGKLNDFLSRLPELLEAISEEHTESFLTGFAEASRSFPREQVSMFEVHMPMRLIRFGYFFLEKIKNEEMRSLILANLINNTSEITPFVHLLSYECSIQEDHKNGKKTDEKMLFNEETLAKLVDGLCGKLKELATKDELKKLSDLDHILYFWKRHGNEKEALNYVKQMIKNGEHLMVIKAFRWHGLSHTMGDYVSEGSYKINIGALSEFIDPKVVKDWVQERLSSEGVSKEEKTLLGTFMSSWEEYEKKKAQEEHKPAEALPAPTPAK